MNYNAKAVSLDELVALGEAAILRSLNNRPHRVVSITPESIKLVSQHESFDSADIACDTYSESHPHAFVEIQRQGPNGWEWI